MKKLVNLIFRFFTKKYCAYPKRNIECQIEDKTKIQSIIIFSNTALGDFLFNTPSIRAIRKKYPKAKITLIGNPKNKDFISDYPHIDNIVYWRNKYRNFFQAGLALKKLSPDVAILLHSHSPQDIFLAWFSGCQFVIKDRANDSDKKLLTGYSVQSDLHCIQRRLNLINSYLDTEQSDIEMDIPFVAENTPIIFDKEKINVGLQLGASKDFKTWPTENFALLVNELNNKYKNLHFYLTGSPSESSLGEKFGRHTKAKNIDNVIGKLSLKQLPDFISHLDLLITNDTGPMHMAIASKVRTVSTYGMTKPNLTGPYQDLHLHKVVISPTPGNEKSIYSITVEQVAAASIFQLEQLKN